MVDMINLATVLHDQGHYGQAEEIQRQALERFEKVLGPSHPLIWTTMNNLAGVLSSQEKHEQAEEMFRRVRLR